MDVFFEQIIKKKPTSMQKALKVAFVIVGVLLILYLIYAAFLFVAFSSILGGICILVAAGAAFGIKWYLGRMYMEYEYSITNGDFDIDRIIGKAKRQRMLTTNCSDFEEFGVFDAAARQRLQNRSFNARVMAANLDEDGLYYAVVAHSNLGSVLVVIEPDERVKKALKKFIPRMVQKDVFSGN